MSDKAIPTDTSHCYTTPTLTDVEAVIIDWAENDPHVSPSAPHFGYNPSNQ